MTDSMYDKLGDLLKAALEKGEIPKRGEKKAEANAGTNERPHGFETRSKSGEADMLHASNGGERIKNKTKAQRTAMRGGKRGGTKLKIENILHTKDKKISAKCSKAKTEPRGRVRSKCCRITSKKPVKRSA